MILNTTVCQNTCIPTFIPVTVHPHDTAIHIGINNTYNSIRTNWASPCTHILILIPVRVWSPRETVFHIRLSDTHHTTLNIPTCQHACIPTFLSVTVWPSGADIHIGVSDSPYTHLDASVAAQLSTCTSLSGPVACDIDIEGQCQSGALGRFVYVYMQGSSGSNQLLISEVEVYGDPIETRM